MTDTRFYTSRSAAECYQDCPRYRFNQYYLNGKGVVGVQKSVPLVTGSAVHRGVEHLMNRIRIGESASVDVAVNCAIDQYVTDVEKAGFSDKNIKTDRQQLYTFGEQKALVEGLIRAWAIAELPQIVERYKVLAVERDIEPLELAPGVWFQAKVDAELQDKVSNDYFNYSLKTMKQWDDRSENSYKSDLQGITEIWAVEQDAARGDKYLDETVRMLQKLDRESRCRVSLNNLEQMMGFLNKKKLGKRVSGVRFCILIKGARYKSEWDGVDDLFVTHSPLIRGYKMVTPSSIEYAHSYTFPNPANKSGKGRLGKGWEAFNVWEQMGVKEWIDMISSGNVQADCGDVIKQQVVTPVEYFRAEGEMEVGIREIKWQELKIKTVIEHLRVKEQDKFSGDDSPNVMAAEFPHVRKHCEFHFGGPCEYKSLCWKPEVASDPMGSGLYQIRMPHHEAERNQ